MRMAWIIVALLAGMAWGQTTQPVSMPLAQGFLAAAEVLALRQEVALMRGKIAELVAENQQLRETLAAKVKAEAEAAAKETARAAAKKAEPAAAIQLAIKEHRLAIGMTLEEANKAMGESGELKSEEADGRQHYKWRIIEDETRKSEAPRYERLAPALSMSLSSFGKMTQRAAPKVERLVYIAGAFHNGKLFWHSRH